MGQEGFKDPGVRGGGGADPPGYGWRPDVLTPGVRRGGERRGEEGDTPKRW